LATCKKTDTINNGIQTPAVYADSHIVRDSNNHRKKMTKITAESRQRHDIKSQITR